MSELEISKASLLSGNQLKLSVMAGKAYRLTKKVTQGDPCWLPPVFPAQGRLYLTRQQLDNNIQKIISAEKIFQGSAGSKNTFSCCKSLHVSLFFDGTNNNEKNDTGKDHPTNIAKLYHACSPDDYVAMSKGFYAYYMPGVGTPFPEIETYDYYTDGLKYATGGDWRIFWGLIQVYSSIYHAITKRRLGLSELRAAYKMVSESRDYGVNRDNNLESYNKSYGLTELFLPLRKRLVEITPKLVALKLYVYGFSRGAAEARAFVHCINHFLNYFSDYNGGFPAGTLCGIPVSVEFLGIFDTVPAVGLANVFPGATGHGSWADGTQQLPASDLVKNCCHLVAAHEQRQSFALDSVRTSGGTYPANTVEVLYPGMHSDVGGGYPKGDQGKARGGTDELPSQITLHDMYAAAIDAGAPLAIHPEVLKLSVEIQKHYGFREMSPDSVEEFDASSGISDKFNAWRTSTFPEDPVKSRDPQSWCYRPERFKTLFLEQAVEYQLILITAWRIARYASDQGDDINLTEQAFFEKAPQHSDIHAQPYEADFSRQATGVLAGEWKENQRAAGVITTRRNREIKAHAGDNEWLPSNSDKDNPLIGGPLYDASNSRGQLWEASLEFKADYKLSVDKSAVRPDSLINFSSQRTKQGCYENKKSENKESENFRKKMGMTPTTIYGKPPALDDCSQLPDDGFPFLDVRVTAVLLQVTDNYLKDIAYAITTQNEDMELSALARNAKKLFDDVILQCIITKGNNSELDNIISLFDDHIHDSRAWFMHSETGSRETFSGYFLSRMIYFGDKWNKSMQLIVNKGHIYGVDKKNPDYKFVYKPGVGLKLFDVKTGEEVPLDESKRPPATNEIMKVIRKINQQQRDDSVKAIYDALNKTAGSVADTIKSI